MTATHPAYRTLLRDCPPLAELADALNEPNLGWGNTTIQPALVAADWCEERGLDRLAALLRLHAAGHLRPTRVGRVGRNDRWRWNVSPHACPERARALNARTHATKRGLVGVLVRLAAEQE